MTKLILRGGIEQICDTIVYDIDERLSTWRSIFYSFFIFMILSHLLMSTAEELVL